ncbi:MAG: zinc ribbon domain-containing protein [Candidatus Freyarchaeum deiterrae]
MSLNYKTGYKQNEVITVSGDYLKEKGYETDTKGNVIEANMPDEKDNKIKVDATTKGKFTITFEGKKALEDAVNLFKTLTSPKAKEEVCTYCGYGLHETVNYCPSCGEKLN